MDKSLLCSIDYYTKGASFVSDTNTSESSIVTWQNDESKVIEVLVFGRRASDNINFSVSHRAQVAIEFWYHQCTMHCV